MSQTIIDGGTVITMNQDRQIISDGAIVIEDDIILDVGESSRISSEYDAENYFDAKDHAILPGFISTHVHVSGILLRGLGNYRNLYDWLLNVKRPGTSVMTPDEQATAAALYAKEALQSGITTFVENATGSVEGYSTETIEKKLDVYNKAGVRNIYAYAFADRQPARESIKSAKLSALREPEVNHVIPDETVADTESALSTIETLIEKYHGASEGRQSIWPAPYMTEIVTPEGLQGAYRLAKKYDIMTTTHAAEDEFNQQLLRVSGIEYLRNAGYLGDHTLLGHCVLANESDIRMMAATNTKVANNMLANLALGEGIAPVPRMQQAGITVGIGTDNVPNSDTVNMLKDIEYAALVQKGVRQDAGAVTAEKALEMATIDGAKAIGRGDELGSIEPKKLADIVLIDLDQTHMHPRHYLPSAIVYQTQGYEVDTVFCNGDIVMQNREVEGISDRFGDIESRATASAASIIRKAGLEKIKNRSWTSSTN